ncbi:glycosyltransferase [Pontibacter chinhatensis]|uniref:Glycosyltransferase involved in cell wall bisynthesis n=1 Tax=Pontibacter chinhatensis TaxID=1436961 RepID=A0A1I2MYU2_9BACT|nr:glycosyltransferase [Pontibacter chinhatensis]SFF94486.1 Glycosyltransferase involved in cell wall bisynthesis [Pontibacter chinhatensis]
MKVVHVVECFAAGTAHFINLLTQYTSCEHVVIHGERADETSAETVKAKFPQGVKFIHWHHAQREIKPGQDVKALTELIRILKEIPRIDVVHLHSSKAGFLGRAACFLLGIKQVIYTPNGAPFARADVSPKKKSLYILLEKLANKLSGQVVCCSPSEALSYESIGIRTSFINNGTVLPAIPAPKTLVEPGEPFTIVTCGRITEQKNPTLFNQIASSFIHQQEVKFVWIGEGEREQRSVLNAANISITGWLPKEEVEKTVSAADLYLSTSLWEGLPFSVLEALSLGKCLLLSDCVGNKDLVKNDYNGFSFISAEEAVSKIKWLMQNRETLHQMEKNSREWSEKVYDIKVVSRQYQQLYAEIAGKSIVQHLQAL